MEKIKNFFANLFKNDTPSHVITLFAIIEGIFFPLYFRYVVNSEGPSFLFTNWFFTSAFLLLMLFVIGLVFFEDIVTKNRKDWLLFGLHIGISFLYVGSSVLQQFGYLFGIYLLKLGSIASFIFAPRPMKEDQYSHYQIIRDCKNGTYDFVSCYPEKFNPKKKKPIKGKPVIVSGKIDYETKVFIPKWKLKEFIENQDYKCKLEKNELKIYRKLYTGNKHKAGIKILLYEIDINESTQFPDFYFCHLGDLGSKLDKKGQEVFETLNELPRELKNFGSS